MSLTEKCKTMGGAGLWGKMSCYDMLSLRCLFVIQVEMLSRQLSLSVLEFIGEVIAGKQHLGVVSEQMVFKIMKLETVTKRVNVNKREAIQDLSL